MRPAEARLGIDCGSAYTVAVLAGADGWVPLLFDGVPRLPSGVYVELDGTLLTGEQAWQRAPAQPDRFEIAPLRRMSEGQIVLGDAPIDVVDLVAATLRRVATEAGRVAGGPVGDVRLVVPAGWGPRRRTWMRQAAHRAGLGQPTLVEAAVAAGEHLLASGTGLLVGSFVAVCDLGGGFEATVLRRGPTGFEVLATIDDLDGGGLGIDQSFADALATMDTAASGGHVSSLNGDAGARLAMLAGARTAKETLSQHAAVTVALPPPMPAVVVGAAQLESVARPVLERAAQATARAVDAAELDASQLAGVYCIGGGGSMPLASRVLAQRTGLSPVVMAEPGLVAALGAARAGGPPSGDAGIGPVSVAPAPPMRRVAAMVVPGLGSLALVAHFHLSAYYSGRVRGFYDPNRYVLANWGELAMAGVFAVVACLAAATFIASALPASARAGGFSGLPARGQPIGTALLAATAIGLAVAGLYAVGGAIYFDLPNGPFLRWALLPALPIAAAAVVSAVAATRWGRVPVAGWHGFLNFPAVSVFAAAAGMLLIQASLTAGVPAARVLLNGLLGRAGGLLLGIGAAVALVKPLLHRLILAAPLAVFTAAIVSPRATGVLGVIYTMSVTVWWGQRVWHLLRGSGLERPRAG
jgi:hypothetical protein